MNVQDLASHWVALQETMGLGRPVADDGEYERALAVVDALVDATDGDEMHPLWRLIAVAGDRVRAYENRANPWPDRSSPASVLASLMQEHGLRQQDLPEVGSQGVVSEILAGKRQLTTRQVAVLAKRFSVPAEVFLP